MHVVFLSLTGNTRRLADKLGLPTVSLTLNQTKVRVDDLFILLMPSYDETVNDAVRDFLDYKGNHERLVGIVGSGNRNFAQDFGWCAKLIAQEYEKPLLLMVEFSGTDEDVRSIREAVNRLEGPRTEL